MLSPSWAGVRSTSAFARGAIRGAPWSSQGPEARAHTPLRRRMCSSTHWQPAARWPSRGAGGAEASSGGVFPLHDEPTVVAASGARWGPRVQDWVADVRAVNRKYGQAIAERLRELHADGKTIGICGLA